jgi:hypothetical protein
MEPHYKLPLLSAIPRPLAHWYLRLSGRADYYHELHLSYWGLKKLVKDFEVIDYTIEIIGTPEKYGAAYMLPAGSLKTRLAFLIAKHAYWLVQGYVWLLRKPGDYLPQHPDPGDIWIRSSSKEA